MTLVVLVSFLPAGAGADETEKLDPPQFVLPGGWYDEPFELELSTDIPDGVIYYTTDGSTPTDSSLVYDEPIPITGRAGDENYFSEIDSMSPVQLPPAGEIYKGTVIRAKVHKPGYQSSDVVTHTYLVDPDMNERYSLPVISIATDERNLFDYVYGIYKMGREWDENQSDLPWWAHHGNYRMRGEKWERPIHIEFYEPDGSPGFAQDAGVRIHGGASRAYPQKSLRLYSRSDYGSSRFNYQIFPDKTLDDYNRLILRNSGNDYESTFFRDAMMQRLVDELDIDKQAYRPAIVFLNGEYWGIHNIRERLDKHYIETNFGIDRDSVDILTGNRNVEEGDSTHYDSLMSFLETEDLSDPENYAYVNTQMDVRNFMEYNLSQIYFGNYDWPHNNIDYWRPRTPDGRWRWLLYDVDFGFGLYQGATGYTHPTLAWATDPDGNGYGSWATFLLRTLLENDDFRIDFINRMADLLNTTFHPDRVEGIIDEMKTVIDPEMDEHIHRWRRPGSRSAWTSNINRLLTFAELRPEYMRQQFVDYFDLPGTVPLTVAISGSFSGEISVNDITITGTDQWTGMYFEDIPVTITAVSYPGYTFTGWEGIDDDSDTLTVVLSDSTFITAVFAEEGDLDQDLMDPEPYELSNDPYRFNYWPREKPEGAFPPHMVFLQTDTTDPGLHEDMTGIYYIPEDEYHIDDEHNIGYPYRLTRRTRTTGWDGGGITFINTGRGRDLGAAVLALNTTGLDSIMVSWTAGTILPNERNYAIRLQYRIGAGGPFIDVIDEHGNPVEYIRHDTEGHYQFMEPVLLPDEADDREYVQLRWKYYHVGGTSGPRAKLLLDNILVTAGDHPHTLLPGAHDLNNGSYSFSGWDMSEPEGSFPPNMVFLQSRMDDPGIDDEPVEPYHIPFYNEEFNSYHADDQDKFGFPYMLTGRTRISGLEYAGVSFINTGRGRDLGAAVLALNTTKQKDVTVTWTGGTVIPNSRVYAIRMQYRVGTDGPFIDVMENGAPVEYERSNIAGHEEVIGPVTLPPDVEDKPYVQIRWKYYYTGERLDQEIGMRDMLMLGDISVHAMPMGVDDEDNSPEIPEQYFLEQNYPNPFNPSTMIKYGLPERSHVTITVYSVIGREIATLIDEEQSAGIHEVQWVIPQQGIASGVYYYRIEAVPVDGQEESFTEIKPMVILK